MPAARVNSVGRRRRPSAAFDARAEMGRAVASLEATSAAGARLCPENLRLQVAWAWCRYLATVEVELREGIGYVEAAHADNERLRAELAAARAECGRLRAELDLARRAAVAGAGREGP